MIVKAGDTHPIEWTANMDLTTSEVRLVAKTRDGSPQPLDCSIVDAAEGRVQHILTGSLPVGIYRVELEVTTGEDTVTFPNDGYAQLVVRADLD